MKKVMKVSFEIMKRFFFKKLSRSQVVPPASASPQWYAQSPQGIPAGCPCWHRDETIAPAHPGPMLADRRSLLLRPTRSLCPVASHRRDARAVAPWARPACRVAPTAPRRNLRPSWKLDESDFLRPCRIQRSTATPSPTEE